MREHGGKFNCCRVEAEDRNPDSSPWQPCLGCHHGHDLRHYKIPGRSRL